MRFLSSLLKFLNVSPPHFSSPITSPVVDISHYLSCIKYLDVFIVSLSFFFSSKIDVSIVWTVSFPQLQ